MSFLQAAEVKVGLFVVVIAALIAGMSMSVSEDPAYLSKSKKAWFMLPDANGLVKNSQVKSAGIPVGVIKEISLQDGQARIDISITGKIPLYTSATVELKSQGILGDMHIEIYPGSPTDPPLAENSQIINVKTKGNLDSLITQVSEVTASLKEVAQNLKEATSGDGTNKHVLGRIVRNIETITADVAQITHENKDKIGGIVDNVQDVTDSLKEVLANDKEGGFKDTWAKLSHSMKNLDDITSKINRGEGTIGKLVSDETTAENFSNAVDGIGSLLDTANRLEVGVDARTEYLAAAGGAKTYLGLVIKPGLDRFYYIGAVNDPAGVVEKVKTVRTGTDNSNFEETQTYYNRIKFTAFFAKSYWDLTVKAGIFENTGGAGFDYYFLKKRLRFTLEAFDFTRFQLRSYVNYQVFRGIYISAGINDAFNKADARSGYLGAGLYLTNDDLKLLLTRSPF